MKRYMLIFAALLSLACAVSSCHYDEDVYFDKLPWPIQKFIVQYYPDPTVNALTESTDGWYVGLKSGPGFWFNTDYDWTAVDGYGMPLPEVFAFDQFPEVLYDYLEATENTANVFSVKRDARIYSVQLLKSVVTYTISDQKITETTSVEDASET